MTTYTLNGYRRTDVEGGDDIIGLATMSVTVPDGFTDVIFRSDGTASDGLPVWEADFLSGTSEIENPLSLKIDGVEITDPQSYEILMVGFNSGPFVGVTGLSFYFFETDTDYVFQSGGPDGNLDDLQTATTLNAYFNSLDQDDFGSVITFEPDGPFGVNTAIPLANFHEVSITEDDIFRGFAGADTLAGGAGNDEITGLGGDDLVQGQGGFDTLAGGLGNDTVDGGNKADVIFGNEGFDVLVGGNGFDGLYGGQNGDALYGNFGNDSLYGGRGFDQLFGGRQADYLDGGLGNDTLTGGKGFDTFYFARNWGNDVITDFTDEVDTIRIDDNLYGPDLTVPELIERFADQVGDDVVFSFVDDRGTLTIQNATLASIANDIDIV